MQILRRPWTDHEVMRAIRLRKNGHSYQAIDIELGRRSGSTQQKLLAYETKKPHSDLHQNFVTSYRAPPEVIAERDARNAAKDRLDTTGLLFGDPPPGWRALDRR